MQAQKLKEELGDLLFQVFFYSQLGKEQHFFEFGDIVHTLVSKLVRRHPHVFPSGALRSQANEQALSDEQIKGRWEGITQQERDEKAEKTAVNDAGPGLLDDIPTALPALQRAEKLQKRASTVGFDWPETGQVLDKIEEEIVKANPILGEVVYVNYTFYVEKNGKLLNIESINNFGLAFVVDLPFSFGAGEEIIDTPVQQLYSIKISTELSKDNDIIYTTSWGAKGELLEDDDLLLKYQPSVNGEIPYVDFFSNGISQTTHDITYSVIEPTNRSPKTNKCLDKRVELQLGETSVSIKTSKITIVSAPSKPSPHSNTNPFFLRIGALIRYSPFSLGLP